MLNIIIIMLCIFFIVFLLYPYMNDKLRISISEARNKRFDIYLDVRTKLERDTLGYYPSSIHIPSNDIEKLVSMRIRNKDAKILIYCNTGHRAKLAAEKMYKLGYKNVRYIAESYRLLLN